MIQDHCIFNLQTIFFSRRYMYLLQKKMSCMQWSCVYFAKATFVNVFTQLFATVFPAVNCTCHCIFKCILKLYFTTVFSIVFCNCISHWFYNCFSHCILQLYFLLYFAIVFLAVISNHFSFLQPDRSLMQEVKWS